MSLLYGNLKVGRIGDAFCSDETWHGYLKLEIKPSDGGIGRRLVEFITLSEEWNENQLSDLPRDRAEFDAYSDLINSGSWSIEAKSGERKLVVTAPVFFANGEVSWKVTRERPVSANPFNHINPVQNF